MCSTLALGQQENDKMETPTSWSNAGRSKDFSNILHNLKHDKLSLFST